MTSDSAEHWERLYARSRATELSWYETTPDCSLSMVQTAHPGSHEPIVDVGGGSSQFVDELVRRGYADVTVLDIAPAALAASRLRLGAERAAAVHWIAADVRTWRPPVRYGLWHDRAVFHFLVEPADRARYRSVLAQALAPGGRVILGTFADDGPTRCAGLPTARYTVEELAAEFPDYRVEHSAHEEHHTPDGAAQPFTWLLLTRQPDRLR